MDRENSPINCLLEQAASIARRSKITAGTLEPTESYKRKQIEGLISFANSCNIWIDFSNLNISAHNKFFKNVPYSLIGFSYNSKNEFCAVLTQPYIKAEREATEEEIAEYMQALGFEMDYADEFHNDEYEIFDAVPNNVLYGIDGDLYFIDTQIRLKEDFEWNG